MKKYVFLFIFAVSLAFIPRYALADDMTIIGLDSYQHLTFEAGTNPKNVDLVNGLTIFDNSTGKMVQGTLLVDTTQVDFNKVGTYPVTYYFFFQNNGTTERYDLDTINIQITDTTPPVITGVKTIFVPVNTAKVNYLAGVSATDNDKGSILTVHYDAKDVDLTKAGVYTVSYFVSDASGNLATASAKVVVEANTPPDTVPPVLHNVPASYTVGLNQADKNYLEGITATDGTVDLTPYIQYDDSNVNYSQTGSYFVTIFVFDYAGNLASVKVPVTVLKDTTPPYFTNLPGSITVEVGSTQSITSGINAYDDVCGDVSSRIVVSGYYNLSKVGEYQLTFTVSDLNGNTSAPQLVTLHVVDTIPPVITGPSSYTIPINNVKNILTILKPLFTATDNYDKTPPTLTYNLHNANLNNVGTYVLTVTATDLSGNSASKDFIVNVYNPNPPKFYENPIVVGSVVGIIVSGIVTLIGVNQHKKRKPSKLI